VTDIERFREMVDASAGPDACHLWTGPARNAKGYGAFQVGGRAEVAHRWLLGELRGRPLAWPAEVGCHRCDNPQCVNPRHLYVGSHSDNTIDAIERSGHPGRDQRAKTECPLGHPYDDANTGHSNGRRYCRTCKRQQSNNNAKAARRARGLKVRSQQADGRFIWQVPA
jgi:hypothetical protein